MFYTKTGYDQIGDGGRSLSLIAGRLNQQHDLINEVNAAQKGSMMVWLLHHSSLFTMWSQRLITRDDYVMNIIMKVRIKSS